MRYRYCLAGLVGLAISTASLQAEEFSVTSLPSIGFVGRPIPIEITGPDGDYEYRLFQLDEDDPDWKTLKGWSKEPRFEAIPEIPGILSLDFHVRKVGSEELTANVFVGQTTILASPRTMRALIAPLQRLHLTSVSSSISLDASRTDWRASVSSLADISEIIDGIVEKDDGVREISKSSHGQYAIAAMQFVSGLWSYGNDKEATSVGCISQNENRKVPKSNLTLNDYLASEIGCCTDYTSVLSALLTLKGIENRIVVIEGHNFNEVMIDSQWWTLDANTNLLYLAPWEKVSDGRSRIEVYEFSHAGTMLSSRVYRETVYGFRMWVLFAASTGVRPLAELIPSADWSPAQALLEEYRHTQIQ